MVTIESSRRKNQKLDRLISTWVAPPKSCNALEKTNATFFCPPPVSVCSKQTTVTPGGSAYRPAATEKRSVWCGTWDQTEERRGQSSATNPCVRAPVLSASSSLADNVAHLIPFVFFFGDFFVSDVSFVCVCVWSRARTHQRVKMWRSQLSRVFRSMARPLFPSPLNENCTIEITCCNH